MYYMTVATLGVFLGVLYWAIHLPKLRPWREYRKEQKLCISMWASFLAIATVMGCITFFFAARQHGTPIPFIDKLVPPDITIPNFDTPADLFKRKKDVDTTQSE